MPKSSFHPGRLMAVIGGQYGSEGKGVVVAHLADRFAIHVRVGSHNAGHSFKRDGRTWKMQQIPVGWTNLNAKLFIGRGALLSPKTLQRELAEIEKVDPTIHDRLFIDKMAGILDDHHHEAEGGVEGEIHQRIGSTGEGVGAARIARLERIPYSPTYRVAEQKLGFRGFRHFKDLMEDPKWSWMKRYLAHDVSLTLQDYLTEGWHILLEGSQGVGLSITHGPWPYVTTTDCGAAQLCADVGLPPHWLTDVLCVLRTYPIRVAGNSGPLEYEITWEELSRRLGKPITEQTTVTKKTRRIGEWDPDLVERAVTLNAPTEFALMFADYLDAANEGVTKWNDLTYDTQVWIEELEHFWRTTVTLIGTGGPDWSMIDMTTSQGTPRRVK